jgi:hypothetical protein
MGAANMLANITRNWGAFRAMLAMPVAEILTCSCLNWVWTIASDNHAYRKLWPSDSLVRSVSASRNCHQFFIGQIVRVGLA